MKKSKPINLTLNRNHKILGKGTQGRFLRLEDHPHLGVKIYGKGDSNLKKVKRSKDWTYAFLEVHQGQEVFGISLFSQVYEMAIVSYRGKYYPGVVMEYFETKPLTFDYIETLYMDSEGRPSNDPKNNSLKSFLYEVCEDRLVSLMEDLHRDNILLTTDGFLKYIDLSPRQEIEEQKYLDSLKDKEVDEESEEWENW